MHRHHRLTAWTALVALTAAAAAFAQPFTVDWYTVDGGGAQNSTGGIFSLSGTIGQPDAGPNTPMAGGTFSLTGGFWTVTQACFCLGDLNHDGQKNGGDVQQFVQCILAGGDCACADVDNANGLTLSDVPAFVSALLSSNSCP